MLFLIKFRKKRKKEITLMVNGLQSTSVGDLGSLIAEARMEVHGKRADLIPRCRGKQNFPGDLTGSADQTARPKKVEFEANSFTPQTALASPRCFSCAYLWGKSGERRGCGKNEATDVGIKIRVRPGGNTYCTRRQFN